MLQIFLFIFAEEQLDFPVLYASAKEGWASLTFTKCPDDGEKNMSALLDAIIKHVPAPSASLESPFQMLVSMRFYICLQCIYVSPIIRKFKLLTLVFNYQALVYSSFFRHLRMVCRVLLEKLFYSYLFILFRWPLLESGDAYLD